MSKHIEEEEDWAALYLIVELLNRFKSVEEFEKYVEEHDV